MAKFPLWQPKLGHLHKLFCRERHSGTIPKIWTIYLFFFCKIAAKYGRIAALTGIQGDDLFITHKKARKGLLLGAMLLLLTGTNCMAIILHTDTEPAASDIPDPNIVGRWWHSNSIGYNASCVAIARNLVITTAHQNIVTDSNGIVTSKVEIGNITYSIDQYWTTGDIRIAKLSHANLNAYVQLYRDSNEAEKEIVIGGYGRPRGITLLTGESPYGYTWESSSNTTLRFCTNMIDAVDADKVLADFDDLPQNMRNDRQISDHKPTAFEGTVAEFDSGCGWFVDDGVWKLAGLTWQVETHQPIPGQIEAWFRTPGLLLLNPDDIFAWRISTYQEWIDGVITSLPSCTYVETDLDDNCIIDEGDLLIFAGQWLKTDCGPLNNYCQGADFDRINGVNIADFATLASDWLNTYPPPEE